jgi:hypothetical protein
MKLIRAAAVAGIAKTVYDQARKPENQARIKGAIAKARSSRASSPRTRRSRLTRRPR